MWGMAMLKATEFKKCEEFNHKKIDDRKLKPTVRKWRDIEAMHDSLNAEREQDEQAYWDSLLTGEDYNLNAV